VGPVAVLETPAAEEAEKGEHEHDDQDDPEKAHVVSFFSM
jgi:hypothetical protein